MCEEQVLKHDRQVHGTEDIKYMSKVYVIMQQRKYDK